jgi:CRP/FNR family transcriptional regulator, cyclic AMP receptor protein
MLSRAQKMAYLQACPLFSGLDTGTLGVLAETLETERYGAGDEVCVEGEVADRVFVIAEGSLDVYLSGVKTAVRQMAKGDVFGEYGMFKGVRTTSVKASAPCTLLSMDYRRFEDFLSRYPDAMYRLLSVAVSRLEEAEARYRQAIHGA